MGARFVERQFPRSSEEELRQSVRWAIDQDRSVYGSDAYSGSWATNAGSGIVVSSRRFDLVAEAVAWLSTQCEKRGAILVVRAKQLVQFESLPEAAALLAAIQTTHGAREAFPKQVLARWQAAAAHVTCPTCTGTIPPAWLRQPSCPICRNPLFSAADAAALAKMHAGEDAARQALATARARWAAAQPEDPWVWVAGALCAE